jgi:hypothetical protein
MGENFGTESQLLEQVQPSWECSMPKYIITPVGKPRMTRSDKWKQRPPVIRYRMFCDEARLHEIRA